MTRAEIAAFNAGVAAVIDMAQAAADAMAAKLVEKPTRYPFAAEALQAIADEACVLLKPLSIASEIPTLRMEITTR